MRSHLRNVGKLIEKQVAVDGKRDSQAPINGDRGLLSNDSAMSQAESEVVERTCRFANEDADRIGKIGELSASNQYSPGFTDPATHLHTA
jgi:hypothetical protein